MKVFLIGSFSGYNFGDSLVLESAVLYLKGVFGESVEFVVPTSRPEFVRRFLPDENVETISTRLRSGVGIRLFRGPIIRRAVESNLICTTAGILFGRGWYNPLHNWVTTIIPLCRIARQSGTRVFGLHTGVTPPSSPIERWFLQKALSTHDAMAVRDKSSEELARSLSVNSVEVVPDLAFWLLRHRVPSILTSGPSRENTCLVNIASYLDEQSSRSGRVHRDAFIKRAADQLSRMKETLGISICFASTTSGDHVLHRSMSDAMRAPARHVKLYEMDIDDALRVYASARVAIMTRMHAGILAASMQVPLIALSYNPKVDDFMQQMESSQWVRPVRWLMDDACMSDMQTLLAEESECSAVLESAVQCAFDKVDQSRSTLQSLMTSA